MKANRAAGRTWRNAIIAIGLVPVAGAALAMWQFYWRAPKIEPASREKMAFPLPDKHSIVVLPFANMSDYKSEEYFSDGISEEIINALVRWPAIVIIPRTSSFIYKGKRVEVQQVGREMGVRYVLEGSVRREAEYASTFN